MVLSDLPKAFKRKETALFPLVVIALADYDAKLGNRTATDLGGMRILLSTA